MLTCVKAAKFKKPGAAGGVSGDYFHHPCRLTFQREGSVLRLLNYCRETAEPIYWLSTGLYHAKPRKQRIVWLLRLRG